MSGEKFTQLCDVAGDVSRETFERLELFERRFGEWNKRINLSSEGDAHQIWHRHILDSAQLFPLGGDALKWLDVGSGGGFPGIVMAIMLGERRGARVHLVESNRKKAAFLVRVTAETGAPAVVHPRRIEALSDLSVFPQCVTARAVAPLSVLLTMAETWLANGARGLFHKGRDYGAELDQCGDDWTFDLIEHGSRTDPDSAILEIWNLRRRDQSIL